MKYGLMIIRDSESWILKTVRLGVLQSELISGYNNTTTDSDGMSIELLVFSNIKAYDAYCALLGGIIE